MIDFEIEVRIETPISEPEATLVEKIVTAVSITLRLQQAAVPVVMTVALTDDEVIQQLNFTYRGQDKATDVLSFAAGEPMPGMADGPLYLGDVIISVPTARRQAAKAGHSLLAELQLLAVHGTLHLLGLDHVDKIEKREMWAAQTAVMTQLGLPHVFATET